MVEFRVLGPVVLRVQGHDVDLGAKKVRGLLGILLLSPNAAVSADQIADQLWDQPAVPGSAPAKGREPPSDRSKILQSYVSKLRAVLAPTNAATVHTELRHYRLNVDPKTIDYYQFRALVESGTLAARRGDHIRAVADLTAAVGLWRARPLADVNSSWAFRYAETMTAQDLLPAYQKLIESHLELGNYEQVLSSQRSPIGTTYETDEKLAGLRLLALAKLEGQTAVKNSYTAFVTRLREVADSEPSEWLVQTYRRLQDQATGRWHALRGHRSVDVEHSPPQLLPREVRNFIGRADIFARLDTWLDPDSGRPGVAFLYGIPGVGKTALAVQWAYSRGDRFPDGVLFADLSGFGRGPRVEPSAVVTTFLHALGLPTQEAAPGDLLDSVGLLRRALSTRRMLVVLDNVGDATHVRPLLAATSPCPLLITSRQKLSAVARATGAHAITVPTLPMDEATALLEHRIGVDRAQGDLTATHDLALLCDGLPLALQVAGEHVAGRTGMGLPDLVDYLREGRLLDAGSHGDAATLRALFDVSADALPAEANRLYQLIGLHPSNTISTAAAAAIADLPLRETELVLDVLVGTHLVEQQEVDSYRMHELLHMHANDRALARLSDVDIRVAERRAADWYLLSTINAEDRISPLRKRVPPLPGVTDVRPATFRDRAEAMRWCLREQSQVLAVARHAADIGLHHHVWRLIGNFTDVLNRHGDPQPVIDLHQIALASARAVGARDGEAGTLNNLGVLLFRIGRFDTAGQLFQQARTAFRGIDELGECIAVFNLANVLLEQGALRRAIDLHRQGLAIATRIGDKPQQAKSYQRLGDAQHRLEHPDLAVEHLDAARALWAECGDERGMATTLTKLAEIRLEARDVDGAVDYCEQALAIDRRVLDDRQTAAALRVLARARYLQGRHDESVACAEESVTLCRRMQDPRGEARSLDALAHAYHAIGDHELAQGIWRNALRLCQTTGDTYAGKVSASLEDPSTSVW